MEGIALMKKYLSVVLALLMVLSLLVLASCSKPTNAPSNNLTSLKYVGDRKFKNKFDSITTLEDILDEISVVDLKQEMNVSGLDKETETDEASSTSIDYYYRNKVRIYAVYNGYGESLWKFFTTSKSNVPITASYWSEGDISSVSIESDESKGYKYSATYNNLGTDFGNGAQRIEVGVSKGGESYVYTIIDNYYFISSASYWDENGDLHRYQADYNADTKKLDYQYDEIVVFGKIPELSSDDLSIKKAGINAYNLNSVDILLGKHKVYKIADGEMSISAETTLVFTSESDANRALNSIKSSSVKAKDFTVEEYESGEYYLINIGTCYFEMSPDFKDANSVLMDLAINEFDDYSYRSIDLDENGKILAFNYSSISYY